MKAVSTLWLLVAWPWYLHSLLRKVHAEPRLRLLHKFGLEGEGWAYRGEGCGSQQAMGTGKRRDRGSDHGQKRLLGICECRVSLAGPFDTWREPHSVGPIADPILSCHCPWPRICLDVLSGHDGCIPELWLQSHIYISITGLGISLLLCGSGLLLFQSSTISAVWCKDLPFALFSCWPFNSRKRRNLTLTHMTSHVRVGVERANRNTLNKCSTRVRPG